MKLFLILVGVTLAVGQTDVTNVSSEGTTGATSVTVTESSSTEGLTSETTANSDTTEIVTESSTATPDERCDGDKYVYSEGCFDYCMKQIDRENLHIRQVYPVFVENRVCKVYSRLWFFFVSKEGVCKKQEFTRRGRTEVRGVCVISEKDA